jgi:hypothetical protein
MVANLKMDTQEGVHGNQYIMIILAKESWYEVQISLRQTPSQVPVALAYNPSYSKRRDQED